MRKRETVVFSSWLDTLSRPGLYPSGKPVSIQLTDGVADGAEGEILKCPRITEALDKFINRSDPVDPCGFHGRLEGGLIGSGRRVIPVRLWVTVSAASPEWMRLLGHPKASTILLDDTSWIVDGRTGAVWVAYRIVLQPGRHDRGIATQLGCSLLGQVGIYFEQVSMHFSCFLFSVPVPLD